MWGTTKRPLEDAWIHPQGAISVGSNRCRELEADTPPGDDVAWDPGPLCADWEPTRATPSGSSNS
jgi:hypothetical protein